MLLRGTRIIKLSGRQEMLSRTESSPGRRLRASSNGNTGRFFIISPSFPFAGELSPFLALLSARSVVGSPSSGTGLDVGSLVKPLPSMMSAHDHRQKIPAVSFIKTREIRYQVEPGISERGQILPHKIQHYPGYSPAAFPFLYKKST